MNDDLDRLFPQGDPPDVATIRRISTQLATTATPVRPLPSNAVLWAVSLGIFLVVSLVVASAVKLYAIGSLSRPELFVYYGLVLLLAGLFARALTEQMIPGERRILNSYILWITALAALALLMAFMFADHDTEHFVASGIPCLRLGLIGALISGLLGWRLFRRGYLVTPTETMLLYGFFAGLVGVATLALHCPIRNSLHCLVWHLGAMVVAGCVGLLLGKFVESRGDAS